MAEIWLYIKYEICMKYLKYRYIWLPMVKYCKIWLPRIIICDFRKPLKRKKNEKKKNLKEIIFKITYNLFTPCTPLGG